MEDRETTESCGPVRDWNPDCVLKPLGREFSNFSMCSGGTDVKMGLDGYS